MVALQVAEKSLGKLRKEHSGAERRLPFEIQRFTLNALFEPYSGGFSCSSTIPDLLSLAIIFG